MNQGQRIRAFVLLGDYLRNLTSEEFQILSEEAKRNNAWFTEFNVRTALTSIANFLKSEELTNWLSEYSVPQTESLKRVGVVMAGNIPLVGFHDYLSVLITGNKLIAKLSSSDNVLIKKLTDKLIEFEPEFSSRVEFVEKLDKVDAVIATGSDNSARYFHYYFSKIPHIIRANRVSCAVLNGEETETELSELGLDILLYFGMGCRNVAKVYVPKGFDLTKLLKAVEKHLPLVDFNKYYNNYDYNKSIFIVNQDSYLDNGFLLLSENTSLASPVSVLYYEYYNTEGEVSLKIESMKEKIQVIVSNKEWYPGSVDFGKAQYPELNDYADGVDTIEFLEKL